MLLHDESPAAVESRDRSFLLGTYARTSFHPRKGKGAQLISADGKTHWDLLGGIAVNVLGYQHPRLMATLREESRNLLHVSNLYHHPAPGILAEKLVESSLLSRVFFCNSGTEANEAALKFARLAHPGRSEVVALEGSFHGRTLGSLSVTGQEAYRTPFAPLVPGARFVAPNDIQGLRAVVSENTSAIFLEPILGEGGIIPLQDSFLIEARKLADQFGSLLVFDEIQCGLGRTGKLFAFQHSGVVPDIITLAKPLGGGLPLGAVLTGAALDGVVRPGHHGTTFGGNPLACRLGMTVLQTIEQTHLLERVTTLGQWFRIQLESLHSRQAAIRDVRGLGMMWGIELDRPGAPIVQTLREKGFIVGTAGERVLRLLPPYIIPKRALSAFVTALEELLIEGQSDGQHHEKVSTFVPSSQHFHFPGHTERDEISAQSVQQKGRTHR